MANWIIALLFGLSIGTWIYSKLMRSTGSNKSSSLVAAAISAILIFLLFYIVLGFIMPAD